MLNLKCIVPMADLTSTFGLSFETLVQVKVRTHNAYGWGDYSAVNVVGGKIRRIPDTMPAPTITSYSDTSITVSWTALTSPLNGDSDILSYDLRWNNGAGLPTIELSNVLATSYVVTSITPGTTYAFVVRARNIYGYSAAYSPSATATAIDAPGKPAIPTVTAPAVASTDVTITWTAPALTHGSAVDAYDMQFLTNAGTYVNLPACAPIAASAQFSAMSCVVPMATILSATSLPVDKVI